jgi:hypothetical protein
MYYCLQMLDCIILTNKLSYLSLHDEQVQQPHRIYGIMYYICNKINRPHKPEGLSSYDIPLQQVRLLNNVDVLTI